MIRKKLSAHGGTDGKDALSYYFPKEIDEEPIDVYLLDRSFYKPRDLIWRLSLAQRQFPNADKFTGEILKQTEIEYSAKLWQEIVYELSAVYARDEIDSITSAFSGIPRYFDLNDIDTKFARNSKFYSSTAKLLQRRSSAEVLEDLYRLGAVGNAFRVGSSGSQIRNRWIFRGDSQLLLDKRMELHPALTKHLSAVQARRRGSR